MAFTRCRNGDYSQAGVMLSVQRQRMLLGLVSDGGNDVFERMAKCVRLELAYSARSIYTNHGQSGDRITTVAATSRLPLALDWADANGPALKGTGQFTVHEYAIREPSYTGSCPFTATTTQGLEPLEARVVLDLDLRQKATDQGAEAVPPAAAPLLLMTRGRLQENYEYCGQKSSSTTHSSAMGIAHQPRLGELMRYRFDEWLLGEPPVAGTFDDHYFGSPISGIDVDFTLALTLRHTPGG
jgi:hypothetical protein